MGKMCATNDVVEVRERRIRQPIACQICGRPSLYSYYSVQCCEGCKQFFRRVMVHQKEYFCRQKIAGNCQLQNGDKCNGCRLDRCLLTGMQPLLVTLPDNGRSFGNFLAKLEARKLQAKDRRQNAQLKIAATNYGEAIISNLPECRLLDSLLFTLNKHKAIWTADPQLSSAYLNRFHSIQQLVQQPDNILARAHQFPPCKNVSWDKAAYIEEMDLFGFGVEHNIKASAIDRLLFVEMAKTLPFFHRLDAGDQMLLLKHTCGPATLLMNCYYSAQAAADTITRSNGLCFMAPFVEVDRFRKDSKLFTMGHVLLCQSVSIVKRMDLSPADFALLLGLLYCSSTASGLSAHGRDLLYAESVLHSRALLNLLQSSLGPVAGANKYSECVLLLGIFFQMEHNLQTMYTYLEFFLSDKNLRTDIPKPIEYLTP